MKTKFFGVILLFLATTFSAYSQSDDNDVVNFTAILQDVFDITVTAGNDVTATFATAADFNNGVTAVPTSTVIVEATQNWYINISAADLTDGGGQVIPIDNVGVWITDNGNHTNGTEVSYTCVDAGTAQALTNAEALLIGNASQNAGTALDNSWIMTWVMGTMAPGMHATSVLEQMSAGDFDVGTYTTTINLDLYAE